MVTVAQASYYSGEAQAWVEAEQEEKLIKQIDDKIFAKIHQDITDFRVQLKDAKGKYQREIIEITKDFHNYASKKLKELKKFKEWADKKL